MPRWVGIADALSVTVAGVLIAVLLARLGLAIADVTAIPFALGLTLGFVAADIASALVHWVCDTYFDPRVRLIGPMIIAPFRDHHVDPTALCRHGVLNLNGNNCLASLPLLALALDSIAEATAAQSGPSLRCGFLTAASITLCLTNQIHAWAHSAAPPRLVRWLQRAGVLLAPHRHGVHHSGGRSYAVVSGWCNAWLDPLLARAELVLAACGARPAEPRSRS